MKMSKKLKDDLKRRKILTHMEKKEGIIIKKPCSVCKRWLTAENFCNDRRNNPPLRSKCKECERKYQRQQYALKKAKRQQIRLEMNKILKINGCAICGYNKCITALVFHHVNPKDKKFSINMRNLTDKHVDNIIKEVNKCILLCMNCHAETHFKELDRNDKN